MAGDPPGKHQWITMKTRPWRKSTMTLCWICGARPVESGNYGE